MRNVYLDHNSSSPVLTNVARRVADSMTEFGNPSSTHYRGKRARELIEEARKSAARFLGVPPSALIFTSGGTESNNLALKGAVDYLRYVERVPEGEIHVISCGMEHMSVIEPLRDLARAGCRITFLPVYGSGRVKVKDFEQSLTPQTRLASIMLANNETGVIQPVERMVRIARRHGVLFHTDAVQAIGRIGTRLGTLGADFFSLSGHKFGAPKGIGLLYVKEGTELLVLNSGGPQEQRLRAGTENVPGIVGMGEVFRILENKNMAESLTKMARLSAMLREGIAAIPHTRINGDRRNVLPNTVNATFKGIETVSLLMHLDMLGICASGGSACEAESHEGSHVLKAMGFSAEDASASVRFSLADSNSEQDIRYVLKHLPGIVAKLRDMSPSYRAGRRQARRI